MNGSMHRRARIRHQQHVGRLDALPAGDRRAVERVAELELVVVELLGRHGDVLLLAARVGEAEVDELDLLVLDHFQHVGCGGHAVVSWGRCEKATGARAPPPGGADG